MRKAGTIALAIGVAASLGIGVAAASRPESDSGATRPLADPVTPAESAGGVPIAAAGATVGMAKRGVAVQALVATPADLDLAGKILQRPDLLASVGLEGDLAGSQLFIGTLSDSGTLRPTTADPKTMDEAVSNAVQAFDHTPVIALVVEGAYASPNGGWDLADAKSSEEPPPTVPAQAIICFDRTTGEMLVSYINGASDAALTYG